MRRLFGKNPCVRFDAINHVRGGFIHEDAEAPELELMGWTSCPIRNTCLGLARWIIAFADMKFAPRNKQSIHVPAATARAHARCRLPCAFLTPHLRPVQPPLGKRAQPQNGDGLPCQRTAAPSHSVLSP